MKKITCLASLILALSACSSTSQIDQSIREQVERSVDKPTLSSKIPAPYDSFGAPQTGGACEFEKIANAAQDDIGLAGWAIIDAKTGAVPERVILEISSKAGKQYSLANQTLRPDVGAFFKNEKLSTGGFEQVLSIPKVSRPASIAAILAFEGKLYKCSTRISV